MFFSINSFYSFRIIRNGTKQIQWKQSWLYIFHYHGTLKILLIDVASSLEETTEVISILLRELETLQSLLEKKDKELEIYRIDGFTVETQKNEVEDQNYMSEFRNWNYPKEYSRNWTTEFYRTWNWNNGW